MYYLHRQTILINLVCKRELLASYYPPSEYHLLIPDQSYTYGVAHCALVNCLIKVFNNVKASNKVTIKLASATASDERSAHRVSHTTTLLRHGARGEQYRLWPDLYQVYTLRHIIYL